MKIDLSKIKMNKTEFDKKIYLSKNKMNKRAFDNIKIFSFDYYCIFYNSIIDKKFCCMY